MKKKYQTNIDQQQVSKVLGHLFNDVCYHGMMLHASPSFGTYVVFAWEVSKNFVWTKAWNQVSDALEI